MDANDVKAFNGDGKMTTSDIMRLTTMAQDVASIVASFVPGAGTGVAAGLGVTSMGTDLVADILDPAVSSGEVAKNLAVNAGFAVAGMIPGAKMGKVAKNVIKWAPRLMTIVAGSGLAMDESTQNTFKKIAKGEMQFTREDWKNISRVLQFAAGTVRTGKGAYDAHKVKKGIVASDNVKLEGVKSTSKLDGKEVDLEIPKTTYDEINTKLGKIDKKAKDAHQQAVDVLKEYKTESGSPLFTDDQINQILKSPTLEGTKIAYGKYQLTKAKDTVDEGKTYDNLRDLWNKDAAALQRQSETAGGRAAIWFANKLGGGAYGANQRAILADPSFGKGENPAASLLDYQGRRNPFVDWKRLRNQAGMQMMSDRNPAVEKPYDGTDKVGGGIHVNPTKNDTPSSLDIPKMKALPAPSEYPIAVSKGVRQNVSQKALPMAQSSQLTDGSIRTGQGYNTVVENGMVNALLSNAIRIKHKQPVTYDNLADLAAHMAVKPELYSKDEVAQVIRAIYRRKRSNQNRDKGFNGIYSQLEAMILDNLNLGRFLRQGGCL